MLYAKSERLKIFHFRGITERCPSWLKERDWKSRVLPKVVPGVRIPLSPPYIFNILHKLKSQIYPPDPPAGGQAYGGFMSRSIPLFFLGSK
jgi:hypothetical protein